MKNKYRNSSSIKVKTLLFYLMMFLFVLTFNSGIINTTPVMSSADELFLLLSFLIIINSIFQQMINKRLQAIFFIFLLYLIYHLLNYLNSPFDLKLGLVMAQSIINIKVFVVALAILLIWEDNATNIKSVTYILYLFIGLFAFGFFANVLLGESWNIFLAPSEKISYRYGFIRPIGWLGHPAQNAYFLVLTFATLLLLYAKKPMISAKIFVNKLFVFTIIDFLLAFPLTVRKGMMMVVPFGLAAFSTLKGHYKVIFAAVALLYFGVFLFLINDMQIMQDTLGNLSSMTTDEDNSYIRGLMIFYGFSLFLEFFPFGVGGATFGTVLSQYNTFDVYSYVGLNIKYYNEGRLTGVYDSGMFSMLAENGFIGILLIGLFIYYFFRFNKNRLDSYNYIIFKIITWFTLLLSLTEPAWQNGMFTVFYVINLLIIYTKNNVFRINNKWVRLESKKSVL
jgi:hypothetical protein